MVDVYNSKNFAPSTIDYRLLSAGLEHYERAGYRYQEVPWVVSHESMAVTLPDDREATHTQYGDLVGSGEQSFIELLKKGRTIGKACCITPCFRLESSYDALHHGYFMKLELIDTDATKDNLDKMIRTALGFFATYLTVKVASTGDNMYDIVSDSEGIELGSYGYRSLEGDRFIYGTGVALPRITTVMQMHRQSE